jgi:hypothetical protein
MTGKFSDDQHVNTAVPESAMHDDDTQAEDAAQDYAAVRVHVTNVVDTNKSTSVDSPTFDIPYTVVVQTGTSDPTMAVRELVPADLLRIQFTVISLDSPVVISRSIEEAQSQNNTVTATPYPQGALLPAGQKVQLTGNNQLWVAATVNTSSRVLVIVERAESA